MQMMIGDASVISWSKDSIYVSWKFNTDHTRSNQTELRGYKIRYQAVGSSVVQYTRLIERSVSQYEITHLHENTNYEICVLQLETTSRQSHRPLGKSPPPALLKLRSSYRVFILLNCYYELYMYTRAAWRRVVMFWCRFSVRI